MTKSRDLANLAGSATGLATDSELSAAVAGIDLTNVQRIVPVDSNISVPGAPTSVSGTVDNAQSAVSFVAPTDNGGSTILSYTVISSPGNIKKSGTTSPITITGLTNNTAYTFTVKAHNIAGSSTASTASSSVTPLDSMTADILIVAGGGGGGSRYAGGGGAGGYRYFTNQAIAYNTNYTVTIGTGGAGTNDNGTQGQPGSAGTNSVFNAYTSAGGGGGGFTTTAGGNGGSGGGAGGANSNIAGTGNTPSTSPSQGNNGGTGADGFWGGGGGGSGGVGGNGVASSSPGAGGSGTANSITGSSVTYAAGGGGSSYNSNTSPTTGTANRGNGGGAGGGEGRNGGAGGSGVVILRYLTSAGTITIGAGLTGSTATDGSHKVTTITAGTGNVSWAV